MIFTMYDASNESVFNRVVENVKDNLQQNIYKTIIQGMAKYWQKLQLYTANYPLDDPKSTGAESYRLLAEEVINRGRNTE